DVARVQDEIDTIERGLHFAPHRPQLAGHVCVGEDADAGGHRVTVSRPAACSAVRLVWSHGVRMLWSTSTTGTPRMCRLRSRGCANECDRGAGLGEGTIRVDRTSARVARAGAV